MRSHPAASAFAATLVILAFGFLDYRTGPEIGFSLFYIPPIAAVAWASGRVPAIVVAVVATATWIAADLPVRPDADAPVVIWNGFTRLAIYFFVALSTSRIRAARDEQAALNEQLSRLLAEAERHARTDALTGLANTRAFLEEVRAAVERARRQDAPVCLAYIDLDHFKKINDNFGHTAGDDVLKRISAEIRAVVRTVDVPARLGGDEFAVLLLDSDRDGAEQVANRMIDRVREVARDYPGSGLGASVGIAHFQAAPKDSEELIKAADAAMYRAKAAGKGTVVVVEVEASAA